MGAESNERPRSALGIIWSWKRVGETLFTPSFYYYEFDCSGSVVLDWIYHAYLLMCWLNRYKGRCSHSVEIPTSFTSMRLLNSNKGCDIKEEVDSSTVAEEHGYG